MKKILVTLLCLYSCTLQAQRITLEELIDLADGTYYNSYKYLISKGWRFDQGERDVNGNMQELYKYHGDNTNQENIIKGKGYSSLHTTMVSNYTNLMQRAQGLGFYKVKNKIEQGVIKDDYDSPLWMLHISTFFDPNRTSPRYLIIVTIK